MFILFTLKFALFYRHFGPGGSKNTNSQWLLDNALCPKLVIFFFAFSKIFLGLIRIQGSFSVSLLDFDMFLGSENRILGQVARILWDSAVSAAYTRFYVPSSSRR